MTKKRITSEEVLKIAERIAEEDKELIVALKTDRLTLTQELPK